MSACAGISGGKGELTFMVRRELQRYLSPQTDRPDSAQRALNFERHTDPETALSGL